MSIVRIRAEQPEPRSLARAAEILRRGGLVAFPTETVYGLGANALDPAAVRRIFEVKGRPSFNPLIVHVHAADAARELVVEWPALAERLAERFWPGPLTLVLPKREVVPDLVTAGLTTVAVRVPAHPVALGLLRTAGLPLAAPSANRYTGVSPTTAAHVASALGGNVDLILDAGPTRVGIESTVVQLSGDRPRLLRPGSVSRAALEEITGPLDAAAPRLEGTAARESPGMIGRHYAPRARTRLYGADGRQSAIAEAEASRTQGGRVGALLLSPLEVELDCPVRMPRDPVEYARRLYAELHSLDERGCELILVEAVPESPEWDGVRDRLERAASAS